MIIFDEKQDLINWVFNCMGGNEVVARDLGITVSTVMRYRKHGYVSAESATIIRKLTGVKCSHLIRQGLKPKGPSASAAQSSR